MLRIIFPAGIGGLAASILGADTSTTSPWVTIAAAFLGSGLVAAAATAHSRRRSGEDRAAAAESVGGAADAVAQGATLLQAPLNARIVELAQQNLELTRRNAELEGKLAAARRDEAERAAMESERLRLHADLHELAGQYAQAQVDLANARHENETLRVRVGDQDDRRDQS